MNLSELALRALFMISVAVVAIVTKEATALVALPFGLWPVVPELVPLYGQVNAVAEESEGAGEYDTSTIGYKSEK